MHCIEGLQTALFRTDRISICAYFLWQQLPEAQATIRTPSQCMIEATYNHDPLSGQASITTYKETKRKIEKCGPAASPYAEENHVSKFSCKHHGEDEC